MRDLPRWLYRHLPQEYEHLASDDAINETFSADGFICTVRGERFG